ncbi:hypothetical protein Hanom_Chr04g00306851 [Helianthus anomalus]
MYRTTLTLILIKLFGFTTLYPYYYTLHNYSTSISIKIIVPRKSDKDSTTLISQDHTTKPKHIS